MHRRHTIARLVISNWHLHCLLEQEEQANRYIHDPTRIYNPMSGQWNYHWTHRGHDRQLTEEQVLIVREHIEQSSECAVMAR
jgi:hypothetical protein